MAGIRFPSGMQSAETLSLLDKVLVGLNSSGDARYATLNAIKGLISVASSTTVPEKVPSFNLGSPSEEKIYYGGSGTYTLKGVQWVLDKNINILFWDKSDWNVLEIPIDVEIDLSPLLEKDSIEILPLGSNLFNKGSGKDGWLIGPNGLIDSHPNYGVSGFIRVEEGLRYDGRDANNNFMRTTCYFDGNKEVVSGGSSDPIANFIVPLGVEFVKVSYYLSGKDTFMFAQTAGSYLEFEPFKGSVRAIEGFPMLAADTETDKIYVDNLISNYDSSVSFENKDILEGVKYIKEVEKRGAILSPKQRAALLQFIQGLVDSNISHKMVGFYPFFGNLSTFHLNVFDLLNEATVNQQQDDVVGNNGLIGNAARLILPFKLSDISYRDDGQPDFGAGLLFLGESQWPSSGSSFFSSTSSNLDFQIDYWYPDGKSYVYIGNPAFSFGNMTVANAGQYWHAQRRGDSFRVFGEQGLVNFVNSSNQPAKNLDTSFCGNIRIVNGLSNTYSTRCAWLAKGFTDAEERIFYALIQSFKNKLA